LLRHLQLGYAHDATVWAPSLHNSEETAPRTSEPLQLTDIEGRQMDHAGLALPN
jgi:hypothetical protein